MAGRGRGTVAQINTVSGRGRVLDGMGCRVSGSGTVIGRASVRSLTQTESPSLSVSLRQTSACGVRAERPCGVN